MRRVRFVQEDEDSEESTASDYEAEYAIDAGDLRGGKIVINYFPRSFYLKL